MNRAQACHYEPDGVGLRWMADYLRAMPFKRRKPLTGEMSIKLLDCLPFAGCTKAQWLNRANLKGRQRVNGASAIRNFLSSGRVTLRNGIFLRAD